MSAPLFLAGTPVLPAELPQLLAQLDLWPLVLRRLIERQQSISFKPSEEEQIAFQQAFLARERITDQASLAAWLQRQGITEPQMSQRLFRALQLEQFQQATFGPRVEPLFLERKSALDRVTYSLLRVRERAKALELHLRLEEEEATFADLASTYSQGAEQQLNGLIGPMELGRINPVLAERLRISTPGQLWPPFEAEGWWVILRHERHLPAQLDAAMTQRLIAEMYEQWMFEQVSAALQALESTAPQPAGDAPAPSTELPAADALQPSPAADAPAESRRGLFKSIFGLG
jgi:hypothetical protein